MDELLQPKDETGVLALLELYKNTSIYSHDSILCNPQFAYENIPISSMSAGLFCCPQSYLESLDYCNACVSYLPPQL